MSFCLLNSVTTLAGLGPAPLYLHALSVSVSLAGNGKQVYPRCMGDWLGCKSPAQMEVGRALDWSLDLGLSFVYITIYLTLHYIFLFLFTTLIFTTRLL